MRVGRVSPDAWGERIRTRRVLRCAVELVTGGQARTSLPPPILTAGQTLFQENKMKTLRLLFVASAFTLALALPTFAGEIQTPKTQPTLTPATMQGEIQTPLTGQIETTGSVSEATAIDSATGIALNLLQSLISLF